MEDEETISAFGGVTRRRFLGPAFAGAVCVVSGGLPEIMRAATDSSAKSSTFTIAGDLNVTRLGFGAMRLEGPGEGIWGWPPDKEMRARFCVRPLSLA